MLASCSEGFLSQLLMFMPRIHLAYLELSTMVSRHCPFELLKQVIFSPNVVSYFPFSSIDWTSFVDR